MIAARRVDDAIGANRMSDDGNYPKCEYSAPRFFVFG